MFCLLLAAILTFVPINHGSYYLPTIVWDHNNPLLRKDYWDTVVTLADHDIMTFVCGTDIMKMSGWDSREPNRKFNHKIYVKEIPPNMKTFDGACDTTPDKAKFIMECREPTKRNEFLYRTVNMNYYQPHDALPSFKYNKDYMFFSTSNGTVKSLNSTSATCTMVFRFHFLMRREDRSEPSCLLLGRTKVCEKTQKPTTRPDSGKKLKSIVKSDCATVSPRHINITNVTDTTMTVEWQEPSDPRCNITYYSVCYKRNEETACKETLVPPNKRSIILEHLFPSSQYNIRVTTHTCQGTGGYSEISKLTATLDPVTSAQIKSKKSSIDLTSIGIGFAIGIVLALCSAAVMWWLVTRRLKCKDKEKKVEHISATNARFSQEIDPDKEVITLNTGYRESGQNWKLPQVREEDVSLCVSEA